jgi:hypothetical protein
MKLNLAKVGLVLSASAFILSKPATGNSIDDLIREASQQKNLGDWKDLRDFETWKIHRFLERAMFFSNTVRFGFLTAEDKEFSVVVVSGGRWPEATINNPRNRYYVEFDNKYYPFLPGSAEERKVFQVLSSTPIVPRLIKSRRYEHVQSLLDAFGPRNR